MPVASLTDDRLRIIVRNRVQQGPFLFVGFDRGTSKMVGPFFSECTQGMLNEAIIALNEKAKEMGDRP